MIKINNLTIIMDDKVIHFKDGKFAGSIGFNISKCGLTGERVRYLARVMRIIRDNTSELMGFDSVESNKEEQENKKHIHNPVTGKKYEVVERLSKYKGSKVEGLWRKKRCKEDE